ncbi:hypothetical protein BJH93_05290 [Kocuria polaris]|nr:hypothetical protein [Kocuria polaris]
MAFGTTFYVPFVGLVMAISGPMEEVPDGKHMATLGIILHAVAILGRLSPILFRLPAVAVFGLN